MKYVIDSSVAIKWVLAEQDDAIARRLRDDFRKGVHELLTPEVFHIEVAHTLTRTERQGRITTGQAVALWTDVMTTPPHFHSSFPLAVRAIDISSQMRDGVYDCLYVALAEREQCEFVTADDKLVKNLQAKFPFIFELKTLP
jgi:predicted nucleic acid-binding protein